jgi:hypothetical protein
MEILGIRRAVGQSAEDDLALLGGLDAMEEVLRQLGGRVRSAGSSRSRTACSRRGASE